MNVIPIPIARRIENDAGQSITVLPRDDGETDIETGTDTSYIRIRFADPNALRVLAGHLLTVADEMYRHQHKGGRR